MKKIITVALCVVLMVSAMLCLGISANQGTLSISIDKHTLTLKDNIWMVYFVNSQNIPDGAECGVLIWDEPQQSYTIDSTTTCGEMIYKGVQKVSGVNYDRYEYKNVAARNMATDYYAVAYVKVGDEVTYSALDKYSVLQYAFNQRQKYADDTDQEKLINLLDSMMEYGAASQIYYGYSTNRIANDTYYQITVDGGTLSDGTTSGLYASGNRITIAAPATNAEGLAFSHWVNSAGAQVSTEATYSPEVGAKDEAYTAVYNAIEPEPEITEPTIIVSNATASAGDAEVEVTVELKNNPGVTSLVLSVAYDETVLSLTSDDVIYNRNIGGQAVAPQIKGSPIKLYWINSFADAEGDFVFATLKFKVNDQAASGIYPITVSYKPNDVYDLTETNIPFEILDGKITVS